MNNVDVCVFFPPVLIGHTFLFFFRKRWLRFVFLNGILYRCTNLTKTKDGWMHCVCTWRRYQNKSERKMIVKEQKRRSENEEREKKSAEFFFRKKRDHWKTISTECGHVKSTHWDNKSTIPNKPRPKLNQANIYWILSFSWTSVFDPMLYTIFSIFLHISAVFFSLFFFYFLFLAKSLRHGNKGWLIIHTDTNTHIYI